MNGLADKVIIRNALRGLVSQMTRAEQMHGKNISALARGVQIALSNSAQRVRRKPPRAEGRPKANEHYKLSDSPLESYVDVSRGRDERLEERGPIEDFIKKLKKEKASLGTREAQNLASRLARQERRTKARQDAIKAAQDRGKQEIQDLYIKETRRVFKNSANKKRALEGAKRRRRARQDRLEKTIAKKRMQLAELRKKYSAENKKKRKKTERRIRFVSSRGGRHGFTDKPLFNEIFRVGGYPTPKTWETSKSMFSGYLRKQWRVTTDDFMKNEVAIGPGNLTWKSDPSFLRVLEDGGMIMGGPLLDGYTVLFKSVGRYTNVTFKIKHGKRKRPVRVRGRHFVARVLKNLKQKLRNKNLAKLTNSQWRELGSEAQQ